MKAILGLILIVLGIILGFYFGLWVLFIGGILQFIPNLYPLNLTQVAWGIIKVFCSGIVGWAIFGFCIFIGAFLIDSSN
jgi:hypothetical protein